MSPALLGRFFTTEPPEKHNIFKKYIYAKICLEFPLYFTWIATEILGPSKAYYKKVWSKKTIKSYLELELRVVSDLVLQYKQKFLNWLYSWKVKL